MIFQVCSNFKLEQVQIWKKRAELIAFLYKDESNSQQYGN